MSEGAFPLQLQAQIDSARHRLEDQQDRDRQWTAERFRSLDEKIDGVGDRVTGLIASAHTLKWMIATVVPLAVGAAWALGRLIR